MEKNTVRIQNVMLGTGIPKVCVPVMGKDLREWTEAATAAREQADLIELRLDSVSPELDADRVRQACRTRSASSSGETLSNRNSIRSACSRAAVAASVHSRRSFPITGTQTLGMPVPSITF